MTEAELCKEIVDHPDDDGPRSIYADWLVERGDPRGEFIQLDLAIPPLQGAEREAAVRKRAQLLFENLGWVPVSHVRISRGFAEEMHHFLGGSLPTGPLVLPRTLIINGTQGDLMRALLRSSVAPTIEALTLDAMLLKALIADPPPRLRKLELLRPSTADLVDLSHSLLQDRLKHLVIDAFVEVPKAVTRGFARIDLGPNVREAEIEGTPELHVFDARLAEELRAAGHEVKPFERPPPIGLHAFAGDTPEEARLLTGLSPHYRGPLPANPPIDFVTMNPVPPFLMEKRRRVPRIYLALALLLLLLSLVGTTIFLLVHRR
jgi:uncharacterized protein (TIGR02996 family)